MGSGGARGRSGGREFSGEMLVLRVPIDSEIAVTSHTPAYCYESGWVSYSSRTPEPGPAFCGRRGLWLVDLHVIVKISASGSGRIATAEAEQLTIPSG